MKSIVSIVAMHCICISSFGQSINGFIKDQQSKAVPSATVSLLNAKDSSAIKFSVSDKEGKYTFSNIKEGEIIISVSSVGFEKYFSSSFTYKGGQKTMPVIVLHNNKKDMTAVSVEVTRPLIEMHLDRMVVNVNASPTNAGSNVLEVLAKSPSINVDMDGNISLNGQQGVLILIDGKKTYLSSKELATLLRSMPSSTADQIEIMTTPPAKYDADGMAGVINIKTKKSRNDGLNGTVTSSIQAATFTQEGKNYVLPAVQNNITFNYRKNKINISGSVGYNNYNNRAIAIYDKTYFAPDGTVNGYNYFLVNMHYRGNYSPLNFAIDYTPGKKNTIGIAASTILSSGDGTRNRISTVKDGNSQLLSNYTALMNRTDHFNKTTGNINWKHTIDTTGQEFSLDADYVRYSFPAEEALVTNYSVPAGQTFLNTNSKTATVITAFKGDYTKPIKKGRIEAGVKTSFVNTKLNNEFFRFVNNKWETQPTLNNYYTYEENINAVYINVNRQIKKWSFQTGLRLETVEANGKQTITNAGFRNTNTGLFPSIFIGYDIDPNNTAKVSFSRRINRPSFYALMPYVSIVDSLDIWHGNPYLKPEHSNRIEVSYGLKSKYFFTFSYTVTRDVIRFIAAQVGTQRATEFYPVNIDKLKNISLTVSSPFKITAWWDVNIFTSLFGNKYYNIQNGVPSAFHISLGHYITNSFKFSKTLKGELITNYSTRNTDQLATNEGRLDNFSLGLQKQILKEKGSITFNITDPFLWNKNRYSSHYIRMYEAGTYSYPTRSITLAFSYRFGKVNNQSRQRTTASQEEQNR
ncbi:MAG TPA: outer membrane beta-barrel protein [Chitinophagaceae bacterium]|nr:outer membrane beta-barrel protein [Chitinophagaceae bacterium]